jgi:hypothetical protein
MRQQDERINLSAPTGVPSRSDSDVHLFGGVMSGRQAAVDAHIRQRQAGLGELAVESLAVERFVGRPGAAALGALPAPVSIRSRLSAVAVRVSKVEVPW